MWREPKRGDTPGQQKQFIRCCMRCEYVYIAGENNPRQEKCPKCEWPSYGAPMVYDGWLKAVWRLITQRAYKNKLSDLPV